MPLAIQLCRKHSLVVFGILLLGTSAVEAHRNPAQNESTLKELTLADWSALTDEWYRQATLGYRIADIERTDQNSVITYTARWVPGTDEDYIWYATSWSEFESKTKELVPMSLRLIDIEVFDVGDETHYLGVWRSGNDNFVVWSCPTWTQFVDTWQSLNTRGLSLIDIEPMPSQSQNGYFSLFRADATEVLLGQDKDWNNISR